MKLQSSCLLMMFTLLMIGGCTPSTGVVSSWRDPSVSKSLRFKKILVIVIHPEKRTRQVGEDELVKQIGSDRAIPGDQILTDEDRGDREKIKAKVKQAGIDGVVTMQVTGATKNVAHSRVVSPYSYDSLWEDYDRNYSAADRSAGAPYSQQVLIIRTRIFSVPDEKLVWTGESESFDPTGTRALIDDVARAVVKRLREEGLIEQPK